MPHIDVRTRFDWDTFTRRYWERRPVLYKGTGVAPFELADVFDAAAGAAGGSRSNIQFTVGRHQQLQLEPWLPRESDGSLAAYEARLARRLGARRYALIISSLHASGFRLWSQERTFFAELWRRIGIPLGGAITTLFHGNYEHSPVGVHLDRFTTFLFALQGRKRMRFWRKRPWSEPVSTVLDYAPYLKDSFVAEVEPGDILYWPASYYHVGESAGEGVATSVNVGIPRNEHKVSYSLDDLLRAAFDEAAPPASSASPLARGALARGPLSPELPLALRTAVSALRDVGRRRETPRHIQATWLKHLSAAGFQPVPAPARRRRLRDEERLRVDPRFPLLLEADGRRRWICSANGHVVRGEGSARAVARVVDTLNQGHEVRVGELLRPLRSRETRTRVRHLLEALQGFRALGMKNSS